MRTLAAAARRPQDIGGFIPPVFQSLENRGIRFREGVVTFIAGTPGSMKTGLTTYLLSRWGKSFLYFSADSEPFEMVERFAAAMTGHTVTRVRNNLADYSAVLDKLPGRFCFEDSPTYDDLVLEVAAYGEVHGMWPEVIVIDNLLNLTGDNESEWAAHREHARVIHKLCRITGATVLVLAHASESEKDPGGQPASRNRLQGKVAQLPKVILSLAFDQSTGLKVAAVKNRFGPASPSGADYVTLPARPEANRFYDTVAAMRADVTA